MTTYWCDIGTTGTRTPTIRPISAANIPPQFTTTSHAIVPWSVTTRRTRPRSCSTRSTRVCVRTWTPSARARPARA